MFGLKRLRGASSSGGSRPALTARWIKDALFAHRLAFEREMERDRAELESRFEAYLEQSSDARRD